MLNKINWIVLTFILSLTTANQAMSASVYIENASFESPIVPDGQIGWPYIDGWTEIDIAPLGDSVNTGVFPNTEPNSFNHIVNADGSQLAFLGSEQGNALQQDLSAVYNAGCSYQMTVAIGISSMFPPSESEPVDTLEMALYYRDFNDPNITIDIVTQIVEANGLSSTELQDFSVFLPVVYSNDNWAGRTIGIAIRATGAAGGFWDLDNVRLIESLPASIHIENASFEFPMIDPLLNLFGAVPNIDNWTEMDNDALGSQNTGVFINTEPNHINSFGDYDHIFNTDCNQMAFLGSEAGNAFEQDLSATYHIGCNYHLTIAVGTSFMFTPSTEEPIDYLELALYYRNDSEPVDIVSMLIPAMDPNQLLRDFSLYLPTVNPSDPWAGKNIGIAIRATGAAGGFWDLDNVRLIESLPVFIPIKNASFEFPVIDPLNAYGAGPIIDDWTELDVDPEGLSRNTGVFANTEPNSFDHIVNTDGSQLAFLFTQQGNAIEQELSVQYKPGCVYRLTVAVGVSTRLPPSILEPVDTLELALYYSDVNDSNNTTDIVTRTINAIDLLPTRLRDFSLYLPAVKLDDDWSNKTIGIAIRATGLAGGVWDLDNVRLGESLPIQDFALISED